MTFHVNVRTGEKIDMTCMAHPLNHFMSLFWWLVNRPPGNTFVNPSVIFCFVGTYFKVNLWFSSSILINFLILISKCFVRPLPLVWLVTILSGWFTQCIVIGNSIPKTSHSMLWICGSFFIHSSTVKYSASQADSTTKVCFFDVKLTGVSFKKMRCPKRPFLPALFAKPASQKPIKTKFLTFATSFLKKLAFVFYK